MPTCTVYFDGDCPVCRTEIAHYQRQRGAEAIAWVDASNCDEAALGPGVDRATVLSRFHVREADGTLASGAAGFVAIWRRLPAFAWLATLASFRPVLAVLDAGYWLFLRVRPWWRPRPHRSAVRAGATPMTINPGEGDRFNCRSATRCDRAGPRHDDVTCSNDRTESDMRILMTGATGLIGRELGKLLAARGDTLVCLVRNAPRRQPSVAVSGDLFRMGPPARGAGGGIARSRCDRPPGG